MPKVGTIQGLLAVTAAALGQGVVQRLCRGAGSGGHVGDLLGIEGRVHVVNQSIVRAAAPLSVPW